MAATWAEWSTDAPWDPWLLKQYRATLEGHDNGEAVAINATTINDPSNPAARWRNQGGGGAGLWQAADGSTIGAANDAGFSFSKPISGATASFTGAVSVDSLTAAASVAAASVTASGAISGGTGSFVGAVAAGSVVSSGPISGTTGTFSGFVSAVTATVVGAGAGNDQALFLKHNAGVGAFSLGATSSVDPSLILKDNSGDEMVRVNPSGSTYALDVNAGSGATNAARFTKDVLITTDLGVRAINATGGYSGTTGTFSGAISATTGTFSGGVSAGASSSFTGGVSIVSGGLTVISGGSTITAGGETINGGNLTFGATSQRILGDFSNATVASRLLIQTSTTNDNTTVGVIPNGSGGLTALELYASATPTASVFGKIQATSSSVLLISGHNGASYQPLGFATSGAEQMRIGTDGILDWRNTGNFGTGAGGGAATLGNVSASSSTGPTATARAVWLKVKANGTQYWVPGWS